MKKTERLAALAIAAAAASVAGAGTQILYDNFDGSGGALNGAAADVGGAWQASAGWMDNGVVAATQDSGALLSTGGIQANAEYKLSATVTNMTSQWIALGFARDALEAPGGSVPFNDRFSNELEGIAWMLVRNDPQRNDVEVFRGYRTAGNAYGGDPGVDFGSPIALDIYLDTAGDGSGFMADFHVNGSSVTGGMVSVGITIDDLNYAGFSFDYGSGGTVGVGEFELTLIPAPASLALLGLGGVAARRRR